MQDEKDREIERLKKRIEELEDKIAFLEKKAQIWEDSYSRLRFPDNTGQ
jgi:hypothetical protein